jgi:hypothetical protein
LLQHLLIASKDLINSFPHLSIRAT